MTLFCAVGLEEGQDVLGDVFHHPGGESGILQVRDVLCFYHLVFLKVKTINEKTTETFSRTGILDQQQCKAKT